MLVIFTGKSKTRAFEIFKKICIIVFTHCGQAVVFEQVHGRRCWSVRRQLNNCRRQQ